MLVNEPPSEGSEVFKGKGPEAYYGRWTYKFEEAVRKEGAVGVILVHHAQMARLSLGSGAELQFRREILLAVERAGPSRWPRGFIWM